MRLIRPAVAGGRLQGDRLWEEEPGFDHLVFYADSRNRPAATVSMPYLDPGRCMRFVQPFCDQYGLVAHWPPSPMAGWYWPGSTCIAVLQAAGASEPRWMEGMEREDA